MHFRAEWLVIDLIQQHHVTPKVFIRLDRDRNLLVDRLQIITDHFHHQIVDSPTTLLRLTNCHDFSPDLPLQLLLVLRKNDNFHKSLKRWHVLYRRELRRIWRKDLITGIEWGEYEPRALNSCFWRMSIIQKIESKNKNVHFFFRSSNSTVKQYLQLLKISLRFNFQCAQIRRRTSWNSFWVYEVKTGECVSIWR